MTTRTDELLIRLRVEADQALKPLKNVENQTKKTQQAFNTAGKNSKRFSNGLQNAGYQIQDFAVQVGSGTDAVRAFSQQAPQLLAAFGGIGIAVGTAVAVLAPLAKVLLDSGDSAEKAADSLDTFKAKIVAIGSNSRGPISELTTALEEADKVTKAWILSLLELEKIELGKGLAKAQEELDKYLASITKYTDVIGVSIDGLAVGVGTLTGEAAKLAGIQENLKVDADTAQSVLDLVNAYDGSVESAKVLATELNNLAAQGLIDKDSLSTFKELVSEVDNLSGSLGSLTGSDGDLTGVDDLLESISYAAAGTVKPFNDMGKAALDAANPDPFEALMSELGEVMRTADATAAAMSSLGNLADIGVTFGGKPKKQGEEIKTLLQELQTEAGKWADQFADTLVSGLADGKLAFKDFADYVLQQLARIAISKALEPLFQSFGNWIGDLGTTAAPTTAGLIATPVNDLPLSREAASAQQMIVGVPRMSAPSPSSSPVTVNVMNYGSDDVEVNERKTSRGVEVDVLIKNAVKSGIAAGDFDKVMATSFGTRRMAY